MYKLIPAQRTHAYQIIPYLTKTCYWKEFVEGNTLGQSYETFMLEWVVYPRIPFAKVLVNDTDENKIYGCVIAATTDQLATMPDYTPYLHPRVMEVFGAWFQFPVSDSVVLELTYVEKELRGQGYGSKMYRVAEELALHEKKDCISCFVWACFFDSLINFLKKGSMIKDTLHFPDPVHIPMLYLENRADNLKNKDYFHTEEYLNTKDMLLV